MTQPFLISRVGPPREVPEGEFWGWRGSDEAGGAMAWFWGYAGVLHALASPNGFAAVPAVPQPGDTHAASLGYWAPLHQLLLYRLGWTDPARGLIWWYEAGKPTDDSTLALISQLWDRDRTLDTYLAWLIHNRTNLAHLWHGNSPLSDYAINEKWTRWASEAAQGPARWEWMQVDAGDPLHLYRSATQPQSSDKSAQLVGVDKAQRRAILIIESAGAWYPTLQERGGALPPVSMSWKIDVFIRTLGFLGTYRRSLKTSLWFATKHSIHVQGNPNRAVPTHTPLPW